MKTDDLTWEKLREVAEMYERATASDTRAMMVNSNNRFGKRSQGTSIKTCYRAQRLINLEIPVLVRSLKSSNVELG